LNQFFCFILIFYKLSVPNQISFLNFEKNTYFILETNIFDFGFLFLLILFHFFLFSINVILWSDRSLKLIPKFDVKFTTIQKKKNGNWNWNVILNFWNNYCFCFTLGIAKWARLRPFFYLNNLISLLKHEKSVSFIKLFQK
jgi:hypothetical protein